MNYYHYVEGDIAPPIKVSNSRVLTNDKLDRVFPNLNQIQQHYREFLWDSIPEEREWTATSRMMEYLAMDVLEVSVQKAEGDLRDRIGWQLVLLFHGCGGTSEVSSRVAAHWANLWYQRCRKKVDAELLVPSGFLPHAKQPVAPKPQFVPVPGASYAFYDATRKSWMDRFEINVALADTLEVPLEAIVEGLKRTYRDLLRDGRCRCQLCMPDFEPLTAFPSLY